MDFEVAVDDRGVAGLEQRVFFDAVDEDNMKTLSINLARGVQNCLEETVFVMVRLAPILFIHSLVL